MKSGTRIQPQNNFQRDRPGKNDSQHSATVHGSYVHRTVQQSQIEVGDRREIKLGRNLLRTTEKKSGFKIK